MKLNLDKLNAVRSQTLYVACSGGLDSMALAFYLLQQGFSIHLLHVNYNKRGEQSDLDEILVTRFANKFNLPISISHFPKEDVKGNFQEKARQFRYTFFEKEAQGNPIVTAHHQDDLIETFYMNLMRNSGMKGLGSLQEVNGNIYRPFLSCSKEDIKKYALSEGIPWRDDHSNFENNYTRNRWRNVFLPFLKDEFPNLTAQILLLTDVFQSSLIEEKIKLSIPQQFVDEYAFLPIEKFESFTQNDWFLFFQHWSQPKYVVDRFIQWENYENGALIEMESPFIYAQFKTDGFYFNRIKEKSTPQIECTEIHTLPKVFDKRSIYLNPDKLQGELTIRTWKSGDSIASIGVKGEQSVLKIIKDAKIPLPDRQHILVVEDHQNIHWVVGLKVGKLAVSNENDTKMIQVKINY